jgi:hypothetical protein
MPETPSPVLASAASEPFDPQRRRRCADDSCVGVVGAEGRCRVCGLAHPLGAPAAGATPLTADSFEEAADDEPAEVDLVPLGADPDAGFDPSRRLCPDGSCVGVLGDDGRCKVCGGGAGAAGG